MASKYIAYPPPKTTFLDGIPPAVEASYDLRGLYVVKGSSQLGAGSHKASYGLRGLYVKGSSQPSHHTSVKGIIRPSRSVCLLRVRPNLTLVPSGHHMTFGVRMFVKGSSQPDGACFRIDIIYSTFSPETGTALGPGAIGLLISNLFHLPSTSTASRIWRNARLALVLQVMLIKLLSQLKRGRKKERHRFLRRAKVKRSASPRLANLGTVHHLKFHTCTSANSLA